MKPENRERKNEIKYLITLNEEQRRAKGGVYNKDVSFFLGDFGSGKAQPYYSKILTPEGWVQMGDLNIGDIVSTPSGSSNILAIFEQGEKEIYRVYFDDNTFTDCCKDHLWSVSTEKSRSKWKYKGTGVNKKPIYKYPVEYFTISLKEILENGLIKHKRSNYAIPCKPVEFSNKNFKIHPYLLGILLGDGGLTNNSINFTTMDEEIVNRVKELIENDNFQVKKVKYDSGKASTYLITDSLGLRNKNGSKINRLLNEVRILKINTLSIQKHIPEQYFWGSIEQRLELLRGLMDTDGTIDKIRNSKEFSSSSLQLFKDVKRLIESLGGVVSVVKPKYFKNHYNTHYRMNFKISFNPFFLKRKANLFSVGQYPVQRFISKVEKIGVFNSRCILLDNEEHLYFTDNNIITHNTQCAALCALDLLFKKHVDRIFITRPIDFSATGYLTGDINEKMAFHLFPIKQCFYAAYSKEKIDKLFADEVIKIIPIDYMKGITFMNACTIVDEFEDINYSDFKVILSRLGKDSKIIFTGSEEQIAIKDSCIPKIKCLKNYDKINYQVFTSQHRNDSIQLIFDYIKENA